MLTEEALILVATLAASGMLLLGVMELVWPSVPRRMARRPPAPLPPASATFAPADPRERVGAPTGAAVRARLGPPALPELRPEIPFRIIDADATPERGEDATRAPLEPVAEAAPPTAAAAAVAVDDRTGAASESVEAPPGESSLPPGLDADGRPAEGFVVPSAQVAAPATEPTEPAAPAVTIIPPRPRSDRRRPVVADRGRTVLPIDTCQEMYKEHRYTEVVSLGSAALEVHARMASVSHRPDEAAALQDLVGLAKQELGDRDGARAAFGAAIAHAAPAARPTYVRHLLTLVRGVVDGVNVKDDDGVRVRELRACLAAVDGALDVAPADGALTAARKTVVDAVGRICDRLVPFALDEDGDPAARELLLDVAGDEGMAGAWRDRLRGRLKAGAGAEVGQLTVFAVRAVQEGRDDDAMQALERAERLAFALSGSPDDDERREELERRLWWGYTKVGLRRLEREAFDTALDPLYRALRLGRVDDDRLAETRAALVRALDGVVEAVLPALQARRETDAPSTADETGRLARALQAWTAHGLTEQDLGDARDRISRIEQALA